MKKITFKIIDGKSVTTWQDDAHLNNWLKNVDWTKVESVKIVNASVPVLPTQAEQEAKGQKDQ